MPTAVKRCMQVGRTYNMYCKKWCEGITVVQRGRGYPRGSYKLLHQSIRATLPWQKCLLVTRSSSLLRLVPDPIEFMIKPWWILTETNRDLQRLGSKELESRIVGVKLSQTLRYSRLPYQPLCCYVHMLITIEPLSLVRTKTTSKLLEAIVATVLNAISPGDLWYSQKGNTRNCTIRIS